MHLRTVLGVIGCVMLAGCGVESGPSEEEDLGSAEQAICSHDDDDFEVDFLGCTEFAGVGVIPIANARAAVPAEYSPVDLGNGQGLAVVRVANCNNVVIDGKSVGGGTVAQVGVSLIAPEGDGDINNFTVYYDTDSKKLANALKDAGVPARYVPKLKYDYDAGDNTLEIRVPPPSKARYTVEGTVIPPSGTPVPFIANWWATTSNTETKMNTVLPAIYFSGAQMTLTADHNSPLPALLGSDPYVFPILDSYNAFGDAHMVVDVR
ncbi:MAG: hypothetical protein JNL21_34565 [Myxococcales bacterium]|nr:hypothetical protein [Myxococcales bacterium]